jgi:ATP-binding cassette subfamily B protein
MIRSKPGAVVPDRLRGEVAFAGVTFRYDSGRAAVRNLDFEARPGQFIGLVGPSGSGKSTVLSLLLRLYDPDRGRVRIDGRDVRDYDVDGLRERIGVVLSEPILLQATVAENIAYGKPGAAMDEIERAARDANAHEFIAALPEGYETVIAETGASLSAGQRQRIAMARALIKGFDILLVDEPFARLDALSMAEVEKALRRLQRKTTIIYASHNLQEIKDADRILVLMQGKLVAQGSHEELLESCTWYRRVHKMQQRKRPPALLTEGA